MARTPRPNTSRQPTASPSADFDDTEAKVLASSLPSHMPGREEGAGDPARGMDGLAPAAGLANLAVQGRAVQGVGQSGPASRADDEADTLVLADRAEPMGSAASVLDPHQGAGGAETAAAPLPGPDALEGVIDIANWTCIEGWAWDPKNPEKRIRLELVEDGVQLATTIAGRHRRDLAQAGIGDGSHAFRFDLSSVLLTDGRHVLHLRCADTGATVPGSPAILDPSDNAQPALFRWHLDGITDTEVAGWIMMRNQPSHHCIVALKEGSRVVARAVASQFRADLLSAGIGDGCYAFALPMPRSLLDGEEHLLEVVEEESGFSLSEGPVRWRSGAGTAEAALTGIGGGMADGADGFARAPDPDAEQVPVTAWADQIVLRPAAGTGKRAAGSGGRPGGRAAPQVGTRMLFDISDLVYYIGHHPNLTGIQRVQSSIVLAMVRAEVVPQSSVVFLSFNARTRKWAAIPTGFLISLLQDLFLPERQRLISFSAEEARYGHLPGAQEFDGTGVLDDGRPSVLCLLGAAWVQRDYFHRILSFKRRFGTRFVMMVHDLIPIYARDTCDQGTARVFEEFLRRALRHVDHYLSVSENTAKDLRRYMHSLSLPEPAVTVTRNGSSFDEFLPAKTTIARSLADEVPERFVLFVATIEGRKNHQLMLDLWRRMIAEGDDPPHLVCVGRVGWRSERFVAELVESNYLDGKVVLLQEISDSHLKLLYDQCLFTVCPSLYEGWGLPIGESLAAGKICVCSDRASLPEVAGEFGVYIDIDNPNQCLDVIRGLINDDAARARLEAKIRRSYKPVTWRQVAGAIVGACEAAAKVEWTEPYPYALIPYSSEISFAWLRRDADATFGDGLLNRIVDTRRGQFLHEPLQELSFLGGEDARSGGVWAEPENWGTWLCHAAGDLVLGLEPNESQYYYVFLRLRASGPASNLSLRIAANGEAAWEGTVGDRPRNIMLRVRKKLRGGGGGWRLKLRVETDLSPEVRNQIATLDGRVPTIGFERMLVVPETDLKTRLDVLTNFVL
jgi:glycosyltransferase involved in cell wall biosynthesis